MLVKDVMKSPVLSVGPETTLEEAHRLLLEKGIRHLRGRVRILSCLSSHPLEGLARVVLP
jgi:hypothetical protein